MKQKEAEKLARQLWGSGGFARIIPRRGCEIGLHSDVFVCATTFEECHDMYARASKLLHGAATINAIDGRCEVRLNGALVIAAATFLLCEEFLKGQEPYRAVLSTLNQRAKDAFGPDAMVKRDVYWVLYSGVAPILKATTPDLVEKFIRDREIFNTELAKAKKLGTFFLGSLSFARKVGRFWETGVHEDNVFDVRARGVTVHECFRNLRVQEERDLQVSKELRKQFMIRMHALRKQKTETAGKRKELVVA